jgi:hypothetical protein
MPQRLSHGLIASLIKRYTPKGWRVLERESGQRDPVDNSISTDGQAHFEQRIISVLPVLDSYNLFVFLHEVAHARFHKSRNIPAHMEEYEAERFAIDIFHKHDLTVTKEIRENAKDNVRRKCNSDHAADIPINPKVKRWSGWNGN